MPTIVEERPDSEDAWALIEELESHLASLYPSESRHGYSVDKLLREGVAFFVVREDGVPAGCGGVQLYGIDYGELKRMYVRPQFRGRGLGKSLLNRLTEYARQRGVGLLRLETGIYQEEAMSVRGVWLSARTAIRRVQRRPAQSLLREAHRMSIEQLADAAAAGDAETVRRLLADDPSLADGYNDEGWTALHLAATPEIAAMLLDAGAGVDARNRHKFAGPGNSPLSAAVYQQRNEVVRLLIERGADVNQGDNGGFTPLHLAVANGYVESARTLLEAGASPNARTGEAGGQRLGNKTPSELLSDVERRRDDGSLVPPEVDAEMRSLLSEYGAS
jgi:GNAT superfamily N-acetyltransferase